MVKAKEDARHSLFEKRRAKSNKRDILSPERKKEDRHAKT